MTTSNRNGEISGVLLTLNIRTMMFKSGVMVIPFMIYLKMDKTNRLIRHFIIIDYINHYGCILNHTKRTYFLF